MADDLDLIRSRINIVDLVSQRVALKRTGKSYSGLCPFHDDRRPSMTVNPDMGRYRCWSCGASGDVFKWVMETQKVEFGEALRQLAELAGVTLSKRQHAESGERASHEAMMKEAQAFFSRELSKSKAAQAYCHDRSFTSEVIESWGLGYGPEMDEALTIHLKKNNFSLSQAEELFLVRQDGGGFRDRFTRRLTIPIHDERGRIVAYGGRIVGEGIPKYINSSDTPLFHKSSILYGLNRAKDSIDSKGYAVLVEGYMDVIACHRAGVTQAVASLGTSLTADQIRLIKRRTDRVVVLYDSDEPGQKAAEKAVDLMLEAGIKVRVAVPPAGEDPDSLLTKDGPGAVEALVKEAMTPAHHRLHHLQAGKSPKEAGFWDEAVVALSYASSRLELEELVAPLAASYPNAPDKAMAMEALREMAKSARRKRAPGGDARPASQPIRPTESADLLPAHEAQEGRVLRALMDPALAEAAWMACREPNLFRPGRAEVAAMAVRTAFPDKAPQGPVREWIHKITDDAAKDVLMRLLEGKPGRLASKGAVEAVGRVTSEELVAVIQNLQQHRRKREFDHASLKDQDDEALRELVRKAKAR